MDLPIIPSLQTKKKKNQSWSSEWSNFNVCVCLCLSHMMFSMCLALCLQTGVFLAGELNQIPKHVAHSSVKIDWPFLKWILGLSLPLKIDGHMHQSNRVSELWRVLAVSLSNFSLITTLAGDSERPRILMLSLRTGLYVLTNNGPVFRNNMANAGDKEIDSTFYVRGMSCFPHDDKSLYFSSSSKFT